MAIYYNEFDPFAAAWLKELIKDGLIADGIVDERSIADVQPEDLRGFTQCHFFAGIGGWSLAARLAGWSDDRPMWTGSPPCQPFSTAGNRKGQDDERHLWPVFFNLIRECAPSVVFGEQVASAIRTGWFDDLQNDMEAEGYATGMVVLPACSVGASHKRDRLWYFAERVDNANARRHEPEKGQVCPRRKLAELSKLADGMADTNESRQSAGEGRGEGCGNQTGHNPGRCGSNGGVADTIDKGSQGRLCGRQDSQRKDINRHSGCGVSASAVGDTEHDGSHEAEIGRSTGSCEAKGGMLEPERSDSLFWGSSEVIYCRDGKYRPIPTEPALFPLANGVSNRVGLLRGAGNAIVPQVAAEVIAAYMSVEAFND